MSALESCICYAIIMVLAAVCLCLIQRKSNLEKKVEELENKIEKKGD